MTFLFFAFYLSVSTLLVHSELFLFVCLQTKENKRNEKICKHGQT